MRNWLQSSGVERYVAATEGILAAAREISVLLDESTRKLAARHADLDEMQVNDETSAIVGFQNPEAMSDSAQLLAREYGELRSRLPKDMASNLPTELPASLSGTVGHLSVVLPDLELAFSARFVQLQRRLDDDSSSLASTWTGVQQKRLDVAQLAAVEANQGNFVALRERLQNRQSRIQT